MNCINNIKDAQNSWDSQSYHIVSTIQENWGKKVIEWRKWHGNEIIMDAGCGTGRVTKLLAEKVRNGGGKVYATDKDSHMISEAQRNLSDYNNVQFIQASMEEVKLPSKVDVIFSNAALHWVLDHKKVFGHFWELLKNYEKKGSNSYCSSNSISTGYNSNGFDIENGRQLLIQCGGHGNLKETTQLMDKLRNLDQFKDYFKKWKKPWHFAKAKDTASILKDLGYRMANAYLSDEYTTFPDRKSYITFVKTVIMKPYFEYLPTNDLKERFVELFLNEVESTNNSHWSLEYVRLNIIANK